MAAPILYLRPDRMTDDTLSEQWERGDLGDATVTETDGTWQVELISDAGTHYGVISSAVPYDLTGGSVWVELAQMCASDIDGEVGILQVTLDANNSYQWYYDPSTDEIKVLRKLAGVTTGPFMATYLPLTHRWFRIRHLNSQLRFDTSVDGVTWTERYAVAPAFAITSLTVELYAGTFGLSASPGTVIWDNFKTSPYQGGGGLVAATGRRRIRSHSMGSRSSQGFTTVNEGRTLPLRFVLLHKGRPEDLSDYTSIVARLVRKNQWLGETFDERTADTILSGRDAYWEDASVVVEDAASGDVSIAPTSTFNLNTPGRYWLQLQGTTTGGLTVCWPDEATEHELHIAASLFST